ncbi:insulinase family protein [candidate division WOR-3 bacterium]|nr:insulinase family protein [candidate division WOR-3 bacterium]
MCRVYVEKLDKGPWLICEEVPGARTVRFSTFIRVGSILETRKNNGISHFIEHGLFKGTQKRNSREISLEIESKGGSINAYTSSEHTSLYVHVLPEDIEQSVELLSDMLFNSVFDEKLMEKERLVILEEVKGYFDSPEHVLLQRTYEMLFGEESPLALPVEGTSESVKGITINELREYWKRFYYPENMIISAAGKIRTEELCDTIRKHFPEGTGKEPVKMPEIKKNGTDKKIGIFHKRGLKQEYVTLAREIFSYTDKRKYPFLIVNTYLGGGMSSYLFQRFREENPLVYTITTFTSLYKLSGEWGIFFSTDRRNIQRVLDILKNDLKNMRISENDLECVKKKLKGALSIELESLGSKVARNFKEIFYYERYRTPEEVLNNIMSVKLDDVNDMMKELLKPDNLILTVLGGVNHVHW